MADTAPTAVEAATTHDRGVTETTAVEHQLAGQVQGDTQGRGRGQGQGQIGALKETGAAYALQEKENRQDVGSQSKMDGAELEKRLRVPRRGIPPRRAVLSGREGRSPWGAPDPVSGIVLSSTSSSSSSGEGQGGWLPQGISLGSREMWYVLLMQGVGAMLISGSINFGIAVACYKHQLGTRIWPFEPLTVAGDMGVTVIIQQIITMLITSALVHADLNGGPVAPLRKPWPPLLHLPSSPSPHGSMWGTRLHVPQEHHPLQMGRANASGTAGRWFWWAVRAVCTGSERDNWTQRGITWRIRAQRVLWTAVHGLFLCILTFWWYWPIAIAIVAPIFEHKDLGLGGSGNGWTPTIIKLLFGGILALLTNPIMALLAMGAEYNVRRVYPDDDLFLAQPWGEENLTRWRKEVLGAAA